MKIDEIINLERDKISEVQIASDHKDLRDKWLSIKRVLDAICKKLPPAIEGQYKISIDLDSLNVEKNLSDWLLRHLFEKEKICSTFIPGTKNKGTDGKYQVKIITSKPAREYLSGKSIIVKNTREFEIFRSKISHLCNFIEKDSQDKFLEFYKPKLPPKKLYNQAVAPKITYEDLEKEGRQYRIAEITEKQEDRRHKDRIKNERIIRSQEDKRVHALQIIIEHAEPNYPKNKNISINYDYFNYENMMSSVNLLRAFLTKAQNAGCFVKHSHVSLTGHSVISLEGVNLEALKKYKNKLINSIKDVTKENGVDIPRGSKQIIYISKEKGIYLDDSRKYPIRGRRAGLLWKLKDGMKPGKLLNKNLQKLSADIRAINKIFMKKTGCVHDIIVKVDTGGFKLNRDFFDIKFIEVRKNL